MKCKLVGENKIGRVYYLGICNTVYAMGWKISGNEFRDDKAVMVEFKHEKTGKIHNVLFITPDKNDAVTWYAENDVRWIEEYITKPFFI